MHSRFAELFSIPQLTVLTKSSIYFREHQFWKMGHSHIRHTSVHRCQNCKVWALFTSLFCWHCYGKSNGSRFIFFSLTLTVFYTRFNNLLYHQACKKHFVFVIAASMGQYRVRRAPCCWSPLIFLLCIWTPSCTATKPDITGINRNAQHVWTRCSAPCARLQTASWWCKTKLKWV